VLLHDIEHTDWLARAVLVPSMMLDSAPAAC
jgi:hypothetical protein